MVKGTGNSIIMNPPVYICIPTANLGEKSLDLLECCLSSIQDQDYPCIQVVISDHSQDEEIRHHLESNSFLTYELPSRLNLSYRKYTENYGCAAANMNNAIDCVPEGALVKMLFQDDLLKTSDAITLMVARLQETEAHWLGVGCDHIDDNDRDLRYRHLPRWVSDSSMAYGHNLIGSPSVVMFRNCDLRMDTQLRYLNDCEFYYRMGQQYGPPALLNKIVITIRMRAEGLSSTLDVDTIKSQELSYLQKKFGEV